MKTLPHETNAITPRRTPTQQRGREKVDRILESAAILLAELPFEKVTTGAIAERAGVPIGSVYQYFPNKLAVLAELARRAMEEVDAETLRAFSEGAETGWREGIDRAVDATLAAFRRQPGYATLLRAICPTPEFREVTSASNARVAAMLAAHPSFQGRLPQEHLEVVARAAIEAANALQDWALSTESPEQSAKIVGEMKRLLISYLAQYLGGQPGK
jgi:AcrR family transcriptional regulator